MERFSDRLASAMDRVGSVACVGLDPVLEKLPAAVRSSERDPVRAILAFSRGIIDAVADVVAVVKPQSACFERYGSAGVAALEQAIEHAKKRGLLVILDAKRGDIGVSAEHYAAAAFEGPSAADALTVSGYLGMDTVEPFIRDGKGLFVLVRTSNPRSDAVQGAKLADGRTVGEMMGMMVADLGSTRVGTRGLSDIGAVVGATKAAEGETLRARMPHQVFLVPGYGAQGGTIEDVKRLTRRGAGTVGEMGVVVNASRSVIYGFKTDGWVAEVRKAAEGLVGELRGLGRG